MLKTYITAVPLQGSRGIEKVLYRSADARQPVQPTQFPIVQILRGTLTPQDTVKVIAVMPDNPDTRRNLNSLQEELFSFGIGQVQILPLPEVPDSRTMAHLCCRLTDAIPQNSLVYACITYGTKPLALAMTAALTRAETARGAKATGLYYGELQRRDGKFTGEAHLYNELPLLHLADGAPA